jgi:phytoene desaturase
VSARPRLVVIGGGFAGLAAAIEAARQGAAVTLLERAPTLGGKAAEWRSQGFRFDLGPSVFTLPDVVDAIFRDAGRELPIAFAPLEPLCRYHYPSGRVWDVYRDLDATLAGLSAAEQGMYRRALAKARQLYEDAAPTFVRGRAPTLWQLARYGLRYGLRAHPGKRLPDLLDHLGVHGDVRPFFLRFATYFGGDPTRVPAVLHNIAWVELGLGVVLPKGGVHAVVQALAELARDLGVTIHTDAGVRALVQRGNRVREVVSEVGLVPADALVAGGGRRGALAPHPRKRPAVTRPSLSGTVALLGVERRVEDALAAHNIFFPADYAAEFADIRAGRHPLDPTLYLHASVKGDPADAPAGCDNLFVMANAPALPASGPSGERSAADVAAQRNLRATLARRGIDVVDRLRVERSFGPSELAAYGDRGAIYGPAPTGLLATLRPGPRVRGLANVALAGGTVHPGGGIPLALLSGRYAVAALANDLKPGRS